MMRHLRQLRFSGVGGGGGAVNICNEMEGLYRHRNIM